MLPLMRRLDSDPEVDLSLLVSGGHLVPNQGLTVHAIENDGFIVGERVDNVLASDTGTGVSKSFGLACIGYADALDRIYPDILVVPGDRYEALAVAVVAAQKRIAVAHVGGGQLSHGSIDDQNRHAISKLSHLHFTVTPDDRRRLMQMGEDPDRVFVVGMISIDSFQLDQLLDRGSLEHEFGIKLDYPTFLITLHPATADPRRSSKSVDGLLGALDDFPEATLVFTAPNVDGGSGSIADRLRDYADTRNAKAAFIASLGQRNYLSLLRCADLVLGNSSSGINEAPILGTPTVNIGSRQDGRYKVSSIVDCGEDSSDIRDAITRALATKGDEAEPSVSIGEATEGLGLIVRALKEVDPELLLRKRFFNMFDQNRT